MTGKILPPCYIEKISDESGTEIISTAVHVREQRLWRGKHDDDSDITHGKRKKGLGDNPGKDTSGGRSVIVTFLLGEKHHITVKDGKIFCTDANFPLLSFELFDEIVEFLFDILPPPEGERFLRSQSTMP